MNYPQMVLSENDELVETVERIAVQAQHFCKCLNWTYMAAVLDCFVEKLSG